MKYELLIDVDGIVRDLFSLIAKRLNKCVFSYEEGSIIFDIIAQQPHLLITVSPTKYYSVIKRYVKNPIFVSYQRNSWRKGTIQWLNNYFKKYEVIFVSDSEDKVKYYQQAKYVIEDHPNYKSYKNIVLIDTVYNKQVLNPYKRIKTKKELKDFLTGRNLE